MIKNGKPFSNENGWEDKKLLDQLDPKEQEIVLEWVRANFIPIKRANYKHSSYYLKHVMQYENGIYLTNNQFKDAMLICGFNPVDPNELNWRYRISEKSPAIQKMNRGECCA